MRRTITSSIIEFKIKLRKLGYWIFILFLYFLHYLNILSAKVNSDILPNLNNVKYELLNEITTLAIILSISGILFISDLIIKDEIIKIEEIIKSSGIKTVELILGK
ncbi:MAG: hypothetical protein H5U37_07675, partial [Caldisericia bacterium]|nr:hypothetical protein [Caldisericia bacterium]